MLTLNGVGRKVDQSSEKGPSFCTVCHCCSVAYDIEVVKDCSPFADDGQCVKDSSSFNDDDQCVKDSVSFNDDMQCVKNTCIACQFAFHYYLFLGALVIKMLFLIFFG